MPSQRKSKNTYQQIADEITDILTEQKKLESEFDESAISDTTRTIKQLTTDLIGKFHLIPRIILMLTKSSKKLLEQKLLERARMICNFSDPNTQKSTKKFLIKNAKNGANLLHLILRG